jgi:hypothetical protein
MKQSKQSSLARRSPVLASLALACAMFAGNAHAGIPVVDGGHISAQLAKFVQDFGKWAKDFAHYKGQVDHMTQQIKDLGNVIDSAKLGLGGADMLANISPRSASQGIERCDKNSSGGFNPLQLLSGFLGGGSGNYVQKQKELCEQVVYLENAKYNELLKSLKRLQKLKVDGVDAQTQKTKNSKTESAMQSSQAGGANLVAAAQVEAAYVDAVLKTYDGMIAATNQEIQNVADDALKGKKKNMLESVISDVAQTALIGTALSAQKSTCPAGFDCG